MATIVEFDPAGLRCRDLEILSFTGPDGVRSVRLRRDMRTGDHLVVEVAGTMPPADRCRGSMDRRSEDEGSEELFRDRDLDRVIEWARGRFGVQLAVARR